MTKFGFVNVIDGEGLLDEKGNQRVFPERFAADKTLLPDPRVQISGQLSPVSTAAPSTTLTNRG